MTPLFQTLTEREVEILTEQLLHPETVLNLPIRSRNPYYEQSPSVFDPSGHNSELYL